MRLGRSVIIQTLRWACLALSLNMLAVSTCAADAGDAASEYQVKAAFLLNFPGFVEWPAATFSGATQPFVLGVFGKDPFAGALDQMAKTKTVNGRPILIRFLSELKALRSCHMVFFPDAQTGGIDQVATLSNLGILTVGEASSFTARGGMINFVVEGRHVRFQVNPSAAERGRLTMSSKLLQLSIIVGNSPAMTPVAARQGESSGNAPAR